MLLFMVDPTCVILSMRVNRLSTIIETQDWTTQANTYFGFAANPPSPPLIAIALSLSLTSHTYPVRKPLSLIVDTIPL